MGVQFEENNIPRQYDAEKVPKLAGWLISKGVVKNVSDANKIQIIMAIIFFVLAIYFAF